MGGGSVTTALLILVFGIHPVAAVGTDLLFAAVTKTTGTAVHARNSNVDWAIVRRLASGSVPATLLTLAVLSQASIRDAAFERKLSLAIGLALVFAAVGLLLRRGLHDFARRHSAPTGTSTATLSTIVLGAALGCLVTLTSVGAGAFGLAVLCFLYPTIQPVRLVGTDIAHAVPLTLIAGCGHWLIGSIDWSLLASLLVGSMPGIVVGSQLAHRVPERVLLPVLAVVLLFIGGSLVVK